MKLNQLLQKSLRMLLALLVVGAFLAPANEAKAQFPKSFPTLSLTGEDNGYDKSWYPDGRMRITLAKSESDQKEVLVPVFIKWKEVRDQATNNTKHIYTFSMKLRYDGALFEPIGIITDNPNIPDTERFVKGENRTIGSSFDITFNSYADNNFLNWLGIDNPKHNKNQNGATMKIVGESARPLPQTLVNDRAVFKPFFYVKMKVKETLTKETFKKGYTTWFIIDADSIYYNSVQVSGAPNYVGVAGVDMSTTNPLWPTFPYKKGSLMVVTQEKIP